jgi:hypothetical protein
MPIRRAVEAGAVQEVWAEQYAGMVEYRPEHKAVAVDAATRSVKIEVHDDVRADVLNVLPPMRAGTIAVQAGLANSNSRWCQVRWLDFESTAAPDIHVVGDSIQLASLMPKSGHMANNHAKVAAAAIVCQLSGWELDPEPVLTNTCYSFVDAQNVIHVASVHRYDAAEKDLPRGAGRGRRVAGAHHARRHLRVELGAHRVGRRTRVTPRRRRKTLQCCGAIARRTGSNPGGVAAFRF